MRLKPVFAHVPAILFNAGVIAAMSSSHVTLLLGLLSFNGKLADELLEREVFDTLHEAKVLISRWRVHYNTIRPHSSLGYRPPAPRYGC